MNQRQGRGMGWLHCFVGPDWTPAIDHSATPGRSAWAACGDCYNESERGEEKRHQTDVNVKLDDVQCCHILTKVRTVAGGIFFDLLAELEIQDDSSWRIILAAKKSLGDISLFVAL